VALRSYEQRLENIRLERSLESHLALILGDAAQLQQVLLNLVVNAEQSIRQASGHGRIWLTTRRVSGDRVAVDVADDGPGVPPEIAGRIFDPFFTTKPPGVGTGLGLSILYGIVQQHGGEVTVQDRVGGGAVFRVELPIAAAAPVEIVHKAAAVSAPEGEAAGRAERGSRRILVVEDEPTVARLIADVLAEEGHFVDSVVDSREGLELARRYPYDLVVCDLRMPHLDVRGFYRELIRLGSPLEHRLVFVTGDTLASRTVDFLEESGVPYLAKPFLVEELKEAVNRALAGGGPQVPRGREHLARWARAETKPK
jgi:CheY-like chemotaxis protein